MCGSPRTPRRIMGARRLSALEILKDVKEL